MLPQEGLSLDIESDEHRVLHLMARLTSALFIPVAQDLVRVEFMHEILHPFRLDERVSDMEQASYWVQDWSVKFRSVTKVLVWVDLRLHVATRDLGRFIAQDQGHERVWVLVLGWGVCRLIWEILITRLLRIFIISFLIDLHEVKQIVFQLLLWLKGLIKAVYSLFQIIKDFGYLSLLRHILINIWPQVSKRIYLIDHLLDPLNIDRTVLSEPFILNKTSQNLCKIILLRNTIDLMRVHNLLGHLLLHVPHLLQSLQVLHHPIIVNIRLCLFLYSYRNRHRHSNVWHRYRYRRLILG
jgi:hypothetical protein